MNRDLTLSIQIEEALNHDQRVAADSIAVESRSGIVTLSGCASSDRAALAAVQIAASFPKCRGVVNRQVVRCQRRAPCELRWGRGTGNGLVTQSGWTLAPSDGLSSNLHEDRAVPGEFAQYERAV